jgi:hypothetical protein
LQFCTPHPPHPLLAGRMSRFGVLLQKWWSNLVHSLLLQEGWSNLVDTLDTLVEMLI